MYNIIVIYIDSLGDMNKKNIPSSKDPHHNKSTGFRWIKFTAGAAIIASVFSSNPSYNQTTKYPTDLHKNNNLELVQKNDNLDHAKIIHMSFDNILQQYGKEKWLEIIRNHFLIEINTYRKLNNRQDLSLDPALNEAAQKFAEYGSKFKGLWHSFNGKTVEDMWVDLDNYMFKGENVAYGIDNIATVVSDRYYKSEWHKKTMIGLRVSKITGDTITYSNLWIGISWPFIVAEFATPMK